MNSDVFFLILNYNSPDDTLDLVEHINSLNLTHPYHFVIIDNASESTNVVKLTNLISDRKDCTLLFSEDNGGYAKGNNIGLRYLAQHARSDAIVFVCNNDIAFDGASLITALVGRIQSDNSQFCGSLMKIGNNIQYTSFKTNTILDDILTFLPKWLKRIPSGNLYSAPWIAAEFVNGSFFGGKVSSFIKVDFFDERTFLYCEERILGEKIKNSGLNCHVFTDDYYLHKEGEVIKRHFNNHKTLVMLCRSRIVFYYAYRRGFLRVFGVASHYCIMYLFKFLSVIAK